MKKSLVLIFFIFFVLIFANCNAVAPYYLLKMGSYSTNPSSIYPGNEVSVVVSIESRFAATARDINLTLQTSEYFEPLETEKFLERILPEETRTVAFRVKSKESTPAGTYNLTLLMEYDNQGTKITDQDTVTITVSELYKVVMDDLKVNNFYPHIGEEVIVKASVRNTGSVQARQVSTELSLTGSDDFGKFIVLSETQREVDSLKLGESRELEFKLKPSEKIEPGVYSFELSSTCLNCTDTASEKFALQVYGYPELFISGIDYSVKGKDTKKIIQGDLFSLSVQLDNLGKEDVKKVSVEIETDEEILGSKKAYVGSIEADDSSAGLFDLIVSEKASEGYHSMDLTVTYLDELDKEQKLEETFSFYVSPKPPPNPYIPYVFIIVILIIAYFVIKMIFRQLAIRKMQ